MDRKRFNIERKEHKKKFKKGERKTFDVQSFLINEEEDK